MQVQKEKKKKLLFPLPITHSSFTTSIHPKQTPIESISEGRPYDIKAQVTIQVIRRFLS